MNDKHQEWLHKLCLTVMEAVKNSPQVNAWLARFQEEGYSVYLILDTSIGLKKNGVKLPLYREKNLVKKMEPVPLHFEINVDDLAFLKSIGIDPLKEPNKKE